MFSLWTAFTRYACLAAGCCTGKVIEEKNNLPVFYTKYSDPDQLINKKNGTEEIYTHPLTLIEIIIQSIILLMILQFPKYTTQIFSIFSIVLILFSQKYRYNNSRVHSGLAIIALILFSMVCFNNNFNWDILNNMKGVQLDDSLLLIVLSILLMYITSNDVTITSIIEKVKKNKSIY